MVDEVITDKSTTGAAPQETLEQNLATLMCKIYFATAVDELPRQCRRRLMSGHLCVDTPLYLLATGR
jgi:hypothetical protein